MDAYSRLTRIFCRVIALLFSLHLTIVSLHADDDLSAKSLHEMVERAKFYTLDNGLRVILYHRGLAPVFGGAVVVRVGGSDEHVGETGISHMLEHMAFKGTTTVGTTDYQKEKGLLDELEEVMQRIDSAATPREEDLKQRDEINAKLQKLWVRDQLSREFEMRGANGLNATTDKDATKYFVNLPRSAFEFWCWMESERLMHPVMRQFYQERDVVMEERRMRYDDDPEGRLYESLLNVAYLVHPYRNPVIGYPFDIKKLTAARVAEFHKRFYVPGNIAISAVGAIDPEKDIETIRKYFGRIPAAALPDRPNFPEPVQDGERQVNVLMKASPQLFITYHKPNYPHPDDAPVTLMLQILAGSQISPLYTELVKKTQIASDIGYQETPGNAYPNLFLFSVTPKSPHSNEDVLRVFDRVVTRFKKQKIDPAALQMAKRTVAVGYLNQMRSNLSLGLDFATSELLHGSWHALIDWYEQAMRVTPEDVERVAAKYLVDSHRTIGRLESSKESHP